MPEAPNRDILSVLLQGQNLGAFQQLSSQQAQGIAEQTPSQKFGFALMDLLRQYQRPALDIPEIEAREQQAARLFRTAPELIGAAPSLQSQVREAETKALEPTISGIREIRKSFGERLADVKDVIGIARQFGVDLETQQNKIRDDARAVIKDAFTIGGADSLKDLDPTEIDRLEKAAKYPKGYIQGVGQTLKERELQLRREIAELKPPTPAQETLSLYASRIEQSDPTLTSLEDTITKMNLVSFNAQIKLPAKFQSAIMQQYMQAARNFINAVLRRESGAVISPSEFAEARQQYLPQPGDKPETIKAKKRNRQIVFETFRRGAGKAYQPLSELLGEEEIIERGGRRFKVIP